jgi:hypothetical protein
LGPPPPLLPLHPSKIAGNDIGDEGCIALSSSLVHLSHLQKLNLGCKCFWIPRVVVVALLWAAEFAFVALSRAFFMRFCLVLIFLFLVFVFDWGRHRRSSLSIPHTLQIMKSLTKDASRFRHRWFIFLI